MDSPAPNLPISIVEAVTLAYHDLFDYPLKELELVRWSAGPKAVETVSNPPTFLVFRDGYYFLAGKDGLILKRITRERSSRRKLGLAKKAAKILALNPLVEMVGITGALAMDNADEASDIDLMIISKRGTLWTTRLIVLITLIILRIPIRRFGDKNQKDKLCLNIWLDESNLSWPAKDRNIYTAHEIAQITPLINKDKTHERFIYENRWIGDYWPNSVKIRNSNIEIRNKFKSLKFKNSNLNIVSNLVLRTSNLIAFKMQYLYMEPKITREIITPTRAIFHPNNWGELVLNRLKN